MKRTLAALLSLILLFSLHVPACAGDVFGQYVSALPAEVAIHCSEEALNVMGVEDLDELVRMVKYRAQPQAAELLRTSFPLLRRPPGTISSARGSVSTSCMTTRMLRWPRLPGRKTWMMKADSF